jgi:hypothetical protein
MIIIFFFYYTYFCYYIRSIRLLLSLTYFGLVLQDSRYRDSFILVRTIQTRFSPSLSLSPLPFILISYSREVFLQLFIIPFPRS